MLDIITLLLAAGAAAGAAPGDAVYVEEWDVTVETVLRDLDTPWDAEFAPDGRLFITTRPGTLYVAQNGTLTDILHLDVGRVEGGMLGVALHPDFAENGLLYVYHTERDNRVVRYVYENLTASYNMTIMRDIPASTHHNGGRIAFGPDGMLYVATGDALDSASSQDTGSLAGKILRLAPDGSVPFDNPVPGSPVYAYGLRNPQGMAWDGNGAMVAADHGPSGYLGVGHDEINGIVPYGNYGWPAVVGSRAEPGMIAPLIHSGRDTWAPSGIAYAINSSVPSWDGMILYAALRGQHLGVVSPDGSDHQKALDGELGRIRHAFQHPNGTIYLLTGNTDGRGSPAPGDDRLLRVYAGGAPACNLPVWLEFMC